VCFILNQWGLMCAWDCATANVHDTHFQPLIAQCVDTMIVLTDTGFHAKTGEPAHMKVCPRGTWIRGWWWKPYCRCSRWYFYSKKVGHRVWAYFRARLAWMMAAFANQPCPCRFFKVKYLVILSLSLALIGILVWINLPSDAPDIIQRVPSLSASAYLDHLTQYLQTQKTKGQWAGAYFKVITQSTNTVNASPREAPTPN
jgi:hypothetical protein